MCDNNEYICCHGYLKLAYQNVKKHNYANAKMNYSVACQQLKNFKDSSNLNPIIRADYEMRQEKCNEYLHACQRSAAKGQGSAEAVLGPTLAQNPMYTSAHEAPEGAGSDSLPDPHKRQ